MRPTTLCLLTPLKRKTLLSQDAVWFSASSPGARGKSGSNDANAEYIAEIRKVMDEEKIHYQLAELGKVDVGGGGTIAYILACMHGSYRLRRSRAQHARALGSNQQSRCL